MLIDDFIKKLLKLEERYGNVKVELFTQKDAWSWDEHDIDEIFYKLNKVVVIKGKEKGEP